MKRLVAISLILVLCFQSVASAGCGGGAGLFGGLFGGGRRAARQAEMQAAACSSGATYQTVGYQYGFAQSACPTGTCAQPATFVQSGYAQPAYYAQPTYYTHPQPAYYAQPQPTYAAPAYCPTGNCPTYAAPTAQRAACDANGDGCCDACGHQCGAVKATPAPTPAPAPVAPPPQAKVIRKSKAEEKITFYTERPAVIVAFAF